MRGIGLSRQNLEPQLSGTAALPTGRQATRANRAAVAIIAVYLFAKMFYIAKGGMAQPADIMISMLALFIVPPQIMLGLLKSEIALTALIIWVALVNVAWFMISTDVSFLPSILYYVFNLMIVIAFFGVRKRDPALFDRVICQTIVVAIAAQTLIVLAQRFGVGGLRNVGTFRNPNQLAYWGVLMLSIFFMLRRNRLSRIDMLAVVAAIFCEFASASRAGLAALVALLAIWLYFALGSGRKRFVAIFGVVAAGLLLTLSPAMDHVLLSSAEGTAVGTRMTDDDGGSQLEERQYTRILDFYQFTVFGAGEGYLSRFKADNEFKLEIHSSFGTMLFSYGIPGLAIFCLVLWSVYRQLPTELGLYLLPSLLYGITHQGLRFTLFWGMVGVALAIGSELKRGPASAPDRARQPLRETRGSDFLRRRADAQRASWRTD